MTESAPNAGTIAETVVVEAIRARDEVSGKTCPCLQFLCSHCHTVLGVSFDPDWQAEILAGAASQRRFNTQRLGRIAEIENHLCI